MSDGVFPEFGNMTQVLWCIKPVFTNSVDYWWNLICLLKSEDISCLQEAGSSLLIQHYKGHLLPVECLATLCWNTKQRLGCKHLPTSSENRLYHWVCATKEIRKFLDVTLELRFGFVLNAYPSQTYKKVFMDEVIDIVPGICFKTIQHGTGSENRYLGVHRWHKIDHVSIS